MSDEFEKAGALLVVRSAAATLGSLGGDAASKATWRAHNDLSELVDSVREGQRLRLRDVTATEVQQIRNRIDAALRKVDGDA